jgi:putative membrane protein
MRAILATRHISVPPFSSISSVLRHEDVEFVFTGAVVCLARSHAMLVFDDRLSESPTRSPMSPLLPAIVSALHVGGIALSFASIHLRARGALRGAIDDVLAADNAWGVAAIVVVGSGLARAFLGLEKGSNFYLHNVNFFAKMVALGVLFVLELWPMVTLLRARFSALDVTTALPAIGRISQVQYALLVVMLVLAPLMARGVGQF